MNMIETRMEQRGQGGFTLIELLVVIAILAVLAGAAVIGIGAMRENATEQACKTSAETIETAAEAWALDSSPDPTGLVTDATLKASNYLKKEVAEFNGASRTTANDGYVAKPTAGGKCV